MTATGFGRDRVKTYVKPDVVLGWENSHVCVIISGDIQALEAIMAGIEQCLSRIVYEAKDPTKKNLNT